MSVIDEMISELPGHLQSGENIKKMYNGFAYLIDNLKELIEQVEIVNTNNIASATGVQLDAIGAKFAVARNGDADTKYKKRILIKMPSILSKGTIEEVNELGKVVFANNFLGIHESYLDTPSVSASISVKYTVTEETPEQIEEIFKSVVRGGIAINTSPVTFVPIFDFFEFGVTNLATFATAI